MDFLSGEYNVEVINGEFELPSCFGCWLQQFSSSDLILFKVDEKYRELKMIGEWVLADAKEEKLFRQSMPLAEKPILIAISCSFTWKVILPSGVIHEMAIKERGTLVLVGMFDKVMISTYEDHLRNTESLEARLTRCL